MILSLGRGRSCPCQPCMAARLARSARGRKERFSDPRRVRLRAALVGRAALGPPRPAGRDGCYSRDTRSSRLIVNHTSLRRLMLILALNYLAAQLLMEYAQMANEFKARLTIQWATPASDGGTVSRGAPCSKIRRGGENTALPPLSPFSSPCASTVPATTLPLVDLHDLHACTPPNRTHRPGLLSTCP